MTGKIIVIGSINMDLVVYTKRHPQIGETIFGSSFSTFCGGKGANQAVAMARLDADVQMVGKIGEDEFGQVLLDNLNKNRVRTETILTSKTQTGTALITVDDKGQNSIIVVPGANGNLKPEDIDNFEEDIKQADFIVIQLEIPLETVLHAAEIAHRFGVKIILNPAPAINLPDRLYSLVDYLIPNESELSVLSGCSGGSLEEVKAASQVLIRRGVKNVVVTLGEKGVFYLGDDQEILLSAFSVTSIDSTAAGDAYIGGFVTALSEGFSIETAMHFASAAGALTVTKQGAQASLPLRIAVKEFLRDQSII